MAVLEELIGQVLDDKYRIDKQLGQGGMGAVYLATHLGTGRPVALKVIVPQFMANEEFVERFKREAKAAGLLRHPNVVNVTDFGFTHVGSDRLAYLVMEYLKGCNLGDMLKKKGRLPLGFVVDIVEQTCLAINEAHKQGIIHRDLKPDNIWLEPNGRGGYNVKVLDFGLAKLRQASQDGNAIEPVAANIPDESRSPFSPTAVPFSNKKSGASTTVTVAQYQGVDLEAATQVQPAKPTLSGEKKTGVMNQATTSSQKDSTTAPTGRLTQVGEVLGTPLYMSPEQCAGENLDARSDIYSLGVIVYQMLSGETPFSGSLYTLIAKHTQEVPPPLREKSRDIPKSVAAVVMSALAKNRDQRPATAEAFAIALRANAEGEVPILSKANDLYRKHRSTFTCISLLVYLPVFLFGLLVPPLIHKWLLLLTLPITLFANTLSIAACALAVEQLRLSPLNPIRIRPILLGLTKRLYALVTTAIRGSVAVLFGLLKFIIPGLRAYVDHSLYAPVVIMEGKRGKLALARSRALTGRLRSLAIGLQIYDLFICLITLAVFLSFVWFVSLANDLPFDVHAILKEHPTDLKVILVPFFIYLLGITLGHSPYAIVFVMLYLKDCQVGSEDLNQAFNQDFEMGDLPGRSIALHKQRLGVFVSLLGKAVVVLFTSLCVGVLLGIIFSTLIGIDTGHFIFSIYEDPLLSAAKRGYTDIIQRSLATGTKIDFRDRYGKTALIYASEYGHIETVKTLLSAGANLNIKEKNGFSPLMFAAASGYTDTVKALLDSGADVNLKSDNGDTALILAAKNGRTGTVKILLAANADINIKNNSGKTALEIATASGHTDILELFKAASAK